MYRVVKKYPLFIALAAYLLSHSNTNFKHDCLKVCARNCDDFKQCRAQNYGYCERISKFSNGNTHFFFAQFDQRIEKRKR